MKAPVLMIVIVLLFGGIVAGQEETPAPAVTDELVAPPGHIYMEINGTMMWVEPTLSLNSQINRMDYYVSRIGYYVSTLTALGLMDETYYSPVSIEPVNGSQNWAVAIGSFLLGALLMYLFMIWMMRRSVSDAIGT